MRRLAVFCFVAALWAMLVAVPALAQDAAEAEQAGGVASQTDDSDAAETSPTRRDDDRPPAEDESPAPAPGAGSTVDDGSTVDAPAITDGLSGLPLNPYMGPLMDTGGPPEPAYAGSGADALIQLPDLRGSAEPTLLERYGSQGHSLDSALGFGGETDRALNSVAGGIFAIAAWLAQSVVAIFQWAFTVEVFGFIGDAVDSIVGALERTVYAPFIATAVVLAGLWMTWQGLVRHRGTSAAQAAAWTVVALTAAVLFLSHPGAVLNGANQLSTGLSRGVLAAVSTVDAKVGPDDGVTTPAFEASRPADSQLRIAGDRFWRVFIHQPWLVMQFGDLEAGRRYGEPLLAAKTITVEEYEQARGTAEGLEALSERKRGDYAALQEEILADPRVGEWFRGRRAVERVGVATLALMGVALGGVLLALIAAAVLLAEIGFLLLVLMGPVALLLGVHPGTGRVIALRWASLAVGLFIKRIVLGALLAVVLVVNGVLLDATYPLGWLVVIGLQTLVVAAAVAYRKPFLRLIGPTTLPTLSGMSPRPASAPPAEQRRELFRELRTRLLPGQHAPGTASRRPAASTGRVNGRPARSRPNRTGAERHGRLEPDTTVPAGAGPTVRRRRRVRNGRTEQGDPDPRAAADPEELLRVLVGRPPRSAGTHGNGHARASGDEDGET